MTIGEINTKITALTNVDESMYSSALRLIDINIAQHKVQSMIQNSMDEVDFDDRNYQNYPKQTTPLIAGQRDYSISEDEKIVSFKRVDISYDGINYYRARPIDTGEMYTGLGPSADAVQQAKVDSLFSKTAPRYDTAYNSVFIYPAPTQADVNAGGKIYTEWNRELQEFTLAELTAGTKIPGFDTEFHPLLAYIPAYEFLLGTGQNADTTYVEKSIQDLEARLIQTYAKKQIDRDMSLVPLYNNYK